MALELRMADREENGSRYTSRRRGGILARFRRTFAKVVRGVGLPIASVEVRHTRYTNPRTWSRRMTLHSPLSPRLPDGRMCAHVAEGEVIRDCSCYGGPTRPLS